MNLFYNCAICICLIWFLLSLCEMINSLLFFLMLICSDALHVWFMHGFILLCVLDSDIGMSVVLHLVFN